MPIVKAEIKAELETEHLSASSSKVSTKPRKKAKAASGSQIKITPKTKVDEVVLLEDAPEFWEVPRPEGPTVAYVLDFRHCPERLETDDGKDKTIDAYIKRQVKSSMYPYEMVVLMCLSLA